MTGPAIVNIFAAVPKIMPSACVNLGPITSCSIRTKFFTIHHVITLGLNAFFKNKTFLKHMHIFKPTHRLNIINVDIIRLVEYNIIIKDTGGRYVYFS